MSDSDFLYSIDDVYVNLQRVKVNLSDNRMLCVSLVNELYQVKHNEIIRKMNKNKGNFCQPKQISSELCWQNVGSFIKVKILTACIQEVRILRGAPDRNTWRSCWL